MESRVQRSLPSIGSTCVAYSATQAWQAPAHKSSNVELQSTRTLVLQSTCLFLLLKLLLDMASGGRYRRKCLHDSMSNMPTTRMQGTRGIGEKVDVRDPGSPMVSKPASTATSLTSSTVSKQMWTTSANAPFESSGFALRMWKRSSQVNCQTPSAEQTCWSSSAMNIMTAYRMLE